MANYNFKVDDKDFKNKVNNMINTYPNFAWEFLRKIMLELLAKVRKLTPVDTGLLRKSWKIKKGTVTERSAEAEIFNNVNYAASVEYGLYKSNKRGGFRRGRFMLKRSFEELERDLPSRLDAEMKNFVRKNGGN